jgi:phenylacetate-CoA ligase
VLQIPLHKLAQLTPQPTDLDRYELASRDELRAWQREQLAWTLRHACENVPHHRAKFDAVHVHPDDFK